MIWCTLPTPNQWVLLSFNRFCLLKIWTTGREDDNTVFVVKSMTIVFFFCNFWFSWKSDHLHILLPPLLFFATLLLRPITWRCSYLQICIIIIKHRFRFRSKNKGVNVLQRKFRFEKMGINVLYSCSLASLLSFCFARPQNN